MQRLPTLEQIRAEKARRVTERQLSDVARNADEIRERCKRLRGFIPRAWHVLEPHTPYVHGWHHDCLAEHLEAVSRKQILRLQINEPPGCMKSLIASVLFEAWEWGPANMAWLRYLTTSYSETYARRDSRKMRDLIQSEWFRALWPHVVLTRDNEADFENTEKGSRKAAPFTSLTSGRGNRVVIDDPLSVDEAESESDRKHALRLFRESVPSRINDPRSDAIIVIMHRLHPDDPCGAIEQYGMDYFKLVLPMEYDPKIVIPATYFPDPRREPGELLAPEFMTPEAIARIKSDMTSHAYATQYQQQPSAREGGQFKRHWFNGKIVDAVPAGGISVRRWDLAATESDSASQTAGVKMTRTPDKRFYVEDVIADRLSGHKVRVLMQNTAEHDGRSCRIVIPQDPGQAGKDQAESICAEFAGYVIKAVRETGSKETRAEPFAAQCEAGNVYLVRGLWNTRFIDALCSFPAEPNDMPDAAAGAFNELVLGPAPLIVSDAVLARLAAQRQPPGLRR